MPDKNLYIIAGCNGAGKTTASFTLLPEMLDCREFVNAARQRGYHVTLLYFWLSSPTLAQARVATWVQEGGHSIAPHVIERRYWQGLRQLFDAYLPLVQEAYIFDNTHGESVLLARKLADDFHIINDNLYQQLRNQYESGKTA